MHFFPRRRSIPTALPPSLLALLLLIPQATATSRSVCLGDRNDELARHSSCGHQGSLAYCFGHLAVAEVDDPSTALHRLRDCFVHAGCTPPEAQIEAFWTLKRCESPGELRKRQRVGGPDDGNRPGDDATTDAQTNTNEATKTTNKATSDTAKTTESTSKETSKSDVTTTTDPATTTTTGSTTSSTTGTKTAKSTGDPSARTGIPPECFTTSKSSTSVCPTQSTGADAGKTLPCFPTEVAASSCVEGLICQTNAHGDDVCMYAHNGLNTGGIVVAVFFASAAALSVFATLFFCCRDRSRRQKLAKAAEAAAIAREAKNVAAKPRNPAPAGPTSHPYLPALDGANVAAAGAGVGAAVGVGAGAAVAGSSTADSARTSGASTPPVPPISVSITPPRDSSDTQRGDERNPFADSSHQRQVLD